MLKKEKYIVTAALPYANGPLHIGHIAGAYLPADIFVRYNRLKGNDVIFISGTDEHGVPIMIKADNEGRSPKELVEHYHFVIAKSFKRLNISFDNFSGTSRAVHHKLSKEFFLALDKNGYISRKESEQYYCHHDKMFLPDRFLEGICPYCKFDHARGDECPSCGKWLEAEKLLSPRCKLCSNSPVMAKTDHWYIRLDHFSSKIEEWILSKGNLKSNVRQFALSWLKEGLNERAITRDLDWGVALPVDGVSKVLYVWFDAPIGYISSTIEWSKKVGDPYRWKEYWFDKECRLVHFIGKDNIPFHIIVWPALLMGQDKEYILPHDVPANEHLTIEGKKLSTSEGNVIWVDDFLKHFPADTLRYYLASIAPQSRDANFSWHSFKTKNNTELNNILGNFINRSLSFIAKHFSSVIPSLEESLLTKEDKELMKEIELFPSKVSNLLDRYNVKEAISHILSLAQLGNRYFDMSEPWKLIKKGKHRCAVVLNLSALIIKTIAFMLYPFLPDTSLKIWKLIGEDTIIDKLSWDDISIFSFKEGQSIASLSLLFKKIEDKDIELAMDAIKESNRKYLEGR